VTEESRRSPVAESHIGASLSNQKKEELGEKKRKVPLSVEEAMGSGKGLKGSVTRRKKEDHERRSRGYPDEDPEEGGS